MVELAEALDRLGVVALDLGGAGEPVEAAGELEVEAAQAAAGVGGQGHVDHVVDVRPVRVVVELLRRQRGAPDRALYFVAAGSLEVGAYPGGEAAAPVARFGTGSVIGEQSFFDGQPRSMNVWAVGDGELLRLTPEAFEAFAIEEPALARDLLMALGRVLSVRLRQTTSRSK